MSWNVEFLDEDVVALFEALPLDMQSHFERITQLIRSQGLERIREPYVKHLHGPLWEIRMKGKSGISRAVYVTAIGRRIVVVHIFIKKTEKTPRHEIELALKRAREVE
jgi:phage-related protein